DATNASLPCGARISARCDIGSCSLFKFRVRLTAKILRNTAKDALELIEGRGDLEPGVINTKLANGVFVPTSSLFKHRDCASHFAERFKITQKKDRVGKIRDIHRGFHVSDQAMLRNSEECCCANTIKILQQLMHVEDQKLLFRHGILVAIQAVDDDSPNALCFHAGTNFMCKFAR